MSRALSEDPGLRSLLAGTHADPHALLGAHPAKVGGKQGALVRALHPEALAVECLLAGEAHAMRRVAPGLWQIELAGARPPLDYRLRFHFADGARWERDDPYRFLPSLGELDLHLVSEGTHLRLWDALGANPLVHQGVEGTRFAVWAPEARAAAVVGDFCAWDARLFPMRSLGPSGVFELFVPGVGPGAAYKLVLVTKSGERRWKADPLARACERPPGSASRVERSNFVWSDEQWLATRTRREPAREPLAIYEAHLGSWARVPEEGGRVLSYRELAPRLAEHALALGFTHLELLPVMEHPYDPSWGYQVTGYFAPTARHGTPDDLRFLVDHLHARGLGVILDWVPAHFPRDDYALRRFDGSALYEHEDPRRGEHPDWGTLIFNYGRREVANFLVANALYWIEEFHVDGLRVDAVASMLYRDYSRREGEWLPNVHGGREDWEAVDFLRRLNALVAERHPGVLTIAEESTSWPGVTRPVEEGGLGFSLKWNMGWMHDTLRFFQRDPVHRRWHLDDLTFAMLYERHERFLMPLSHDEIVHGKRSLLSKLPGDDWQRFANLRLLLGYQWTRPGKKLLFMGSELAPEAEWRHDESLPWHLAEEPRRRGLARWLADLGRLYRSQPALWRWDHDPAGFRWLSCDDRESTVLAFLREDGDAHLVCVFNLTPVPRPGWRLGVPSAAAYRVLLSSDHPAYGGSGYPAAGECLPEPVPWHGQTRSLVLDLPPLAALVLAPPA